MWMNQKQEKIVARATLKSLWSWVSWVDAITSGTRWVLEDDFWSRFDSFIEQQRIEDTLSFFLKGNESADWEPDETDLCLLQGLFGIRWDNVPDALMMSDTVSTDEAKSFFYHAVKGELDTMETINPSTLNNLLIALKNHSNIFDGEAINEIMKWLIFESNQIYNRLSLPLVNPNIWNMKGGKQKDKTPWKASWTNTISSKWVESTKESLVSLANAIESFLNKTILNNKVLLDCKAFIDKVSPLKTETRLGKMSKK